MSGIAILVVSIVVLALGYVFYGGWLAKQWGVDPSRKTPAYEMEDGVDYVPAKAPVLLGHHFASIAGAGPINGPIQAALFGWVPVLLWILIGGIFIGAVQDFSALFVSVRNKGMSIGEVMEVHLNHKSKVMFSVFTWLVMLLVDAASLPRPSTMWRAAPTTVLSPLPACCSSPWPLPSASWSTAAVCLWASPPWWALS